MNTKVLGIGILAIVAVSVFATQAAAYPSSLLKLTYKDPNTWNVVGNGQEGILTPYWNTATFRGMYLEPFESYTLIYYGDETHNDVWPYATCLKTAKANRFGWFYMYNVPFNYRSYINNGIDEKIWLVKTSDVDCVAGEMTAWNPTEYLFETMTI